MSFFSRPNLDNTQFKQVCGTTLSLSGVTEIIAPSGLTLAGNLGQIPVDVSTNNIDGYVMTYRDGQIGLELSAGSGGTQIYNGTSPTTCTVGGLTSGTSISGCTLSQIIQQIVVPALNPAITPPSNTFTLAVSPSTSTGYYEIGTCVCICGCGTFNRGCVSPAYCGSCDKRSGLPNTYIYTGFFGTCSMASTALTPPATPFSPHLIGGSETYTGKVNYDAGSVVKNSCGTTYCAALPAGTTATLSATVSAVYPYFWGDSATLPVAGQALINSGSKCISTSASDVLVSNYNVSGRYIWFAIPSTSSSKTKWQADNSLSNCGAIPGTLFASETCVTVNSPSGCWNSVPYKFYISNYATSIDYSMTFKNS